MLVVWSFENESRKSRFHLMPSRRIRIEQSACVRILWLLKRIVPSIILNIKVVWCSLLRCVIKSSSLGRITLAQEKQGWRIEISHPGTR